MGMENVFTKNGELGLKLQAKMLNKEISSHTAVKIFEENGIKATFSNLNRIIRNMRKQLERKQIVIVDRPLRPIDARTSIEAIEARLIREPSEPVNLNHVIDNSLLELESVKLEFGTGTREHLASLKLQTDIALKYMMIAPNDDKIDMGQVMKSFDWITDFVETLHEKYTELNIRNEYIVFVEQRQKEAIV